MSKLLNILVVDDDRSTRMLLKAFLMRTGHTVIEAANGQEAVEQFDCNPIDLVLMDVTMPVMTGYEAASLIKQRAQTRFVPIIFLTGLSDEESLAKCVESGGDDFLVKPFNSVLLGAKMASMQRIGELYSSLEQYQQRTEQEIELSHHVFESVLKRAGSMNVPGLEQWMLSAGHFSGDLLIHSVSPSGRLYLMLGDFTGHGFSAAIGALPAADVFYAMTRRDFSVKEIVCELNRKLKEVLPVGHFCAAAVVSCDAKTRGGEIFNGGLPPLIKLDATGQIVKRFASSSFALGVVEAKDFVPEITTEQSVEGCTLILHSDGLSEASNSQGEMFGMQRLEAVIGDAHPKRPLALLKEAVEQFTGGRPQEDDISVVTLKC